MKGIKPISPGCFNYFLMRICSFRKFTNHNGRPEPFMPSRAGSCVGHAWLGPGASPGWEARSEGVAPIINWQEGENSANEPKPHERSHFAINPKCCAGKATRKSSPGSAGAFAGAVVPVLEASFRGYGACTLQSGLLVLGLDPVPKLRLLPTVEEPGKNLSLPWSSRGSH